MVIKNSHGYTPPLPTINPSDEPPREPEQKRGNAKNLTPIGTEIIGNITEIISECSNKRHCDNDTLTKVDNIIKKMVNNQIDRRACPPSRQEIVQFMKEQTEKIINKWYRIRRNANKYITKIGHDQPEENEKTIIKDLMQQAETVYRQYMQEARKIQKELK